MRKLKNFQRGTKSFALSLSFSQILCMNEQRQYRDKVSRHIRKPPRDDSLAWIT
jgi:hypothetical protein